MFLIYIIDVSVYLLGAKMGQVLIHDSNYLAL